MSQLPTPEQADALAKVYADDATSVAEALLDECRALSWVAGRGDHIVPTPEGARALEAYRTSVSRARDS